MVKALTIAIIVLSTLDIICILLQKSKSAGLSGAISGGAEQLFGKKKSKGYEAILFRSTIVISMLLVGVCVTRLIWFT